MTKEDLKQRLINDLGDEYADAINELLTIINNTKNDNYMNCKMLAQKLKELHDIEAMIKENNEQPFITTSRTTKNNVSYKPNPLFTKKERIENKIISLTNKINRKTRKEQQKEENEYDLERLADEGDPVAQLMLEFKKMKEEPQLLHRNRFFERHNGYIVVCFDNAHPEKIEESKRLEEIIVSGEEPLYDWDGNIVSIEEYKPALEKEDIDRLKKLMNER